MEIRKNIVLSGEPGTGKSGWLMEVSNRLKEGGINIGGFITPSVPCYVRSYSLTDLGTGENLPLASESGPGDWFRVGKFLFNPAAVEHGKRILSDPGNEQYDLMIIDEIGPFELAGKIWAEPLTGLLERRTKDTLLVIRESILEKVLDRWKIGDPVIIGKGQETELLSLINKN